MVSRSTQPALPKNNPSTPPYIYLQMSKQMLTNTTQNHQRNRRLLSPIDHALLTVTNI